MDGTIVSKIEESTLFSVTGLHLASSHYWAYFPTILISLILLHGVHHEIYLHMEHSHLLSVILHGKICICYSCLLFSCISLYAWWSQRLKEGPTVMHQETISPLLVPAISDPWPVKSLRLSSIKRVEICLPDCLSLHQPLLLCFLI